MEVADVSCERTGPGLTGEPLNAVIDLAFTVADAGAATPGPRRPGSASPTCLVTLAVISLYSFAFHTLVR